MKRNGLIILIFLTVCAFMAACSIQRAQIAEQARSELLGMSKADLLACAGAPVRFAKVDNMEVLTYVGGGDSHGVVSGGGSNNVGAGGISLKRRYCEVTFVLVDGLVTKVNYTGRTGGLITKGEQCAFVVENCLKRK